MTLRKRKFTTNQKVTSVSIHRLICAVMKKDVFEGFLICNTKEELERKIAKYRLKQIGKYFYTYISNKYSGIRVEQLSHWKQENRLHPLSIE